jgi:hypothetical protein
MPDERLPQRTLVTVSWLAAWFALVCAARGQTTFALGLLLGAAIGMFSLWSLMVAVPRLLGGTNPAGRYLVGAILFLKLPLYAVVLNFAMVSPAISPFAVFVGVALIPIVLLLKVVGHQLYQKPGPPAGDETCRSTKSTVYR